MVDNTNRYIRACWTWRAIKSVSSARMALAMDNSNTVSFGHGYRGRVYVGTIVFKCLDWMVHGFVLGAVAALELEGLSKFPTGITVHDDEVYVTAFGNHLLQVFDLDGRFQRIVGPGSTGAGEGW